MAAQRGGSAEIIYICPCCQKSITVYVPTDKKIEDTIRQRLCKKCDGPIRFGRLADIFLSQKGSLASKRA